MQDMREVNKIISERNLKARAFESAENFDYDFAYCVEDDNFCGVDVDYSDYIKKHYICFTKQPNGNLIYGIAFSGHTPLLRKPATSETICK